jgi:hypothetical protein
LNKGKNYFLVLCLFVSKKKEFMVLAKGKPNKLCHKIIPKIKFNKKSLVENWKIQQNICELQVIFGKKI